MLKFGYPWNQGHLDNTSIESLWLGFDDNHWFLFAGTLRSTLSSTLIWHLAQAIEKLLDTNWSCCNSVSGKVVTATCVCCHQFFHILYQSMICGQEMLKTCVVILFYWCLCTFGAKPNLKWQNSSNCVIKFHQAGFHSNKVYPLKNKTWNSNMKVWKMIIFLFKGGWFGVIWPWKVFPSLKHEPPFRLCEQSWRHQAVRNPGDSKPSCAPVGDTHARLKWNVLQVPALTDTRRQKNSSPTAWLQLFSPEDSVTKGAI